MTELIGQMLGPYRIMEQIGIGGMATVYKAYQASMDRYVAVKVLPRHFAESASFMGRFEQEARTIAKLEHPHILPVHDYGEQDGNAYLVMRLIEPSERLQRPTSPGLGLEPAEEHKASQGIDQTNGQLTRQQRPHVGQGSALDQQPRRAHGRQLTRQAILGTGPLQKARK